MISTRVGLAAVAIGALLGGAVIFGLDYRLVKNQLREAQTEKVQLQAKLDYAVEAARLQEKELIANIDKLKNDIRRKNNLFESQRASNDVATNSLLKHVEDLRLRIETANADTARVTGGRATTVLGECAKEYNRVAAEAERLKIKIEGLQAAVKACVKE